MLSSLVSVWSENPATSLVVWTAISMLVLYLGRKQAHQALYSSGRGLYRCMRLWSYSIAVLEKHLTKRNHELMQSKKISSSVLTQCLTSGLVLLVAGLIAYVNVRIVLEPLSLIIASIDTNALVQTSTVTALVFTLAQMLMGLLLTESMGLTQLFPPISELKGRLNKVVIIAALLMLTILATVEATLFTSRNMAVLGFLLPFALAFLFIPLEMFVQSLRVVLGAVLIAVLRCLCVSIRVLGSLLNSAFMLLRHCYDLVIVVPLGVERLVKSFLNREVQIDVPILTRVDAEAMRANQLKSRETLAKEAKAQVMPSKATFKTVSSTLEPTRKGAKKVIEDSSIAHVNLAETMMSSSL